jgi:hypothetical protein
MRDIHSALKVVNAIEAATLAADNTPPAIDTLGYNAVELLLMIGVGGITFTGTNKIEFVLTHSDDNSTYTAVTAADMLGGQTVATGGIIKSLVAAHSAANSYRFGYKGGKRYLKLLADFSGTHGTGTPIAAAALLGHGTVQPEPAQA